ACPISFSLSGLPATPPNDKLSLSNNAQLFGCMSPWAVLIYATRRLHMDTDRIEKKILLRAPLKRVWRALADSTEFGSWLGMEVDGPFAPGRRMRATIVGTTVDAEVAKAQKQYGDVPFDVFIEQIEPKRLFSFRWHPNAVEPGTDYSAEPTTLVAFALEEVAGGGNLAATAAGVGKNTPQRRGEAFLQDPPSLGPGAKV